LARTVFIKRLETSLDRVVGETTRKKVLKDSERVDRGISQSERAKWVRGAMKRLDRLVDARKRIQIMENCGYMCYATFGMATKRHIKAAEARGLCKVVKNGNTIRVTYTSPFCFCPWIGRGKMRLSPTYCHCGKGYLKKFYEELYRKPVKAKLLKSKLAGAPVCEFAFYL